MLKVSFAPDSSQPKGVDTLVCIVTKKEIKSVSKKGSKSPLSILDKKLGGELRRRIKARGFEGKEGETLSADFLTPFNSVVLLGFEDGKTARQNSTKFLSLGSQLYSLSMRLKSKRLSLLSAGVNLGEDSSLIQILEGYYLSAYSFEKYKSKKKASGKGLNELILVGVKRPKQDLLQLSSYLIDATKLARDLVNTPAADCSPAFLLGKAREISRKNRLKLTVYDKSRLKKLGAGCILGVSQGSSAQPFLLKLEYIPRGKKPKRVISLVGKGITFDSGGLSIKTGAGMENMKVDMSGAAAVLGAMSVISKISPKVGVRAYIPTCENMISGEALRPGDVIRAVNKKTIEVLNTDAEGRLILADALSLASREKCDVIIDLATLTGACVVALGADYAGLFSTDRGLTRDILRAADESAELFWEMPLAEEYRSQIDSPIADLKNIGSSNGGGAIIGAIFLKEFVDGPKWAHLDIAGPASTGADKHYIKRGGVGFGVRTLIRYLRAL